MQIELSLIKLLNNYFSSNNFPMHLVAEKWLEANPTKETNYLIKKH
ncbi:hypothetical protein SAMN05443633_103236 [Chryseobacterium arachidis]|uniref:Uncharacterized protein n=1 Tax=Chryseobacterium arachidis TaxID=1416778 RepID=A0A1M4ZQU1_9FLAO|nr:hypothetical protein SAMN05443633_103236 [Chryseobacterium arachidis]